MPILLVPGSLPEPHGNVENEFKSALLPDRNGNSIYTYLRTKVLGGGFPPTDDEISKAAEALGAEYAKKIVTNTEGAPINQEQIDTQRQAEVALLPAKLKNKVATESRMYVDPEALMAPQAISPQKAPNVMEIWYAQATLWVQIDVCRAIAETNANSKTIPEAPVKRLVSLTIPWGPTMYIRGTAPTASPDVSPNAPPPVAMQPQFTRSRPYGSGEGFPQRMPFNADAGATDLNVGAGTGSNGEPTRQYLVSMTGRNCNKIYDVIGFTMVVHVDQTQLPFLLQNLSKNRLITVKKVDLLRRDNAELLSQGFVYGPAPIVEVTLECEVLQLREWTVPLMPTTIKTQLLGANVEYESPLKPAKKAE